MNSTTQRRTAKAAALLVVPGALLVAAGATTGAASGAAAPDRGVSGSDFSTMSCSHSHSDRDKNNYGYVTADWLKYRTGPHTSCNAKGQAKYWTKIYYHCHTHTDNDGTWTWGRIAGTDNAGWFKNSYLNDGGSNYHC